MGLEQISTQLMQPGFNTGSSDELELPLGQGPRHNSAFSMGFKLETSATKVMKQQLVLVVKTITSQHWSSLGTATVQSRRPVGYSKLRKPHDNQNQSILEFYR